MKLPLCSIICAVIHFGSSHLSNYSLQPPYQIPTDICTIIGKYFSDICTIIAKYLNKTISESCLLLYWIHIHSSNQIAGQHKMCLDLDLIANFSSYPGIPWVPSIYGFGIQTLDVSLTPFADLTYVTLAGNNSIPIEQS